MELIYQKLVIIIAVWCALMHVVRREHERPMRIQFENEVWTLIHTVCHTEYDRVKVLHELNRLHHMRTLPQWKRDGLRNLALLLKKHSLDKRRQTA